MSKASCFLTQDVEARINSGLEKSFYRSCWLVTQMEKAEIKTKTIIYGRNK